MKRSNRLLILLGVFLAVIAMMAVVVLAGGGGGAGGAKATPTSTAEPTVQVVVAKVDMALGDRITADMIETKTKTLSQAEAYGEVFSDPAMVIGKVAGGNVTKGQPLTAGSFMKHGELTKGQDIASAIAPGMVAMSLEVDQVNGVGTLVVPGDHVDVILSVWMESLKITTKTESGYQVEVPGDSHVTTKMVIQNRKVMVTLLPEGVATEEQRQQGGGTPTPEPKETAGTIANTGQHMIVILEVKPDEAEIIRWAQREEKQDPMNWITLGLALRSDKDNDSPNVTTPGITFKQLVTIYGVLPPDPRGILPTDIARQITW